jgi:hypothetical protein
MTKKFSIVRQLDTEKLSGRIAYFVYENGHNPYIFANNATLEALKKPYEQEMVFTSFDGKKTLFKGLIGRHQGYKMFEDNTLKYGEIELR